MRDIEFRQKIKDSFGGGWDYAKLTKSGCLHWKFAIQSFQKGTIGQFTGLKDKNGEEIYEGDIVEFLMEGKEFWQELYEIRYSPHRACWQLHLLKQSQHRSSPQYISNSFTQSEADTIEVIGNIYQNKELLK